MREYKFRGIRCDNKEWIYGDLLRTIVDPFTYIQNANEGQIKVMPHTVGQSTELPDNSGKEIYDGDFVLINDDEIGIVIWDKAELEYGITIDTAQLKMGNFYSKDLEVIGNIHDNPELLEIAK